MVLQRIPVVAITLLFALSAAPADAGALRLVNRPSPKNKQRPRRAATEFIILHTTEGAPKGALAKLRKNGEAHYLVDRDGTIYRIVDKDRVAFHAGRSLWAGRAGLDRRSIGIEVVGYHNRKPKKRQIAALRELVRQLRDIYKVPADRVLTHAQVAYGRPNRYHRYDHRGRKRCAMNLGTPEMREALGLGKGPQRDPDVDAGRVRVADRRLFTKLFPSVRLNSRGRPSRRGRKTPTQVAKAAPAKKTPTPAEAPARQPAPAEAVVTKAEVEPPAPAEPTVKIPSAKDLDEAVEKLTALLARAAPEPEAKSEAPPAPTPETTPAPSQKPEAVARAKPPVAKPARLAKATPKRRARAAPSKPRSRAVARSKGLCRVSDKKAPARLVAGPRYAAATTIYLLPDGRVRTGADLSKRQAHLLESLPEGTRVLEKKTFGGYVKPSRAPSEICGARWRSNETVYRFPNGKLVAGHQVNPARLPKATMVFCAS